MIKILLSLLLSLTISFAAESFKLNPEKVQVNWEAYKTLAKLGVKGTFNTVKLSTPTEARELSQVLNGVSVTIDTTSVNTQNPGRDETLKNMFFGKLSQQSIEAKIVKTTLSAENAHNGTIDVLIAMNGQELTIPMAFSLENSVINAKGTIDLFDFKAGDALASINKSCYDLHQGKTWNDVGISFTLHVEGASK